MNQRILVAALLLACSPALRAETVLEIATGFDHQKIAALEAYLKENPGAEDRDQAYSILVGARLGLGEFEAVPDLLLQQYEIQNKAAGADLQKIFGEIVQPMIKSSVVSDQRDKAKALITKMKTDFAAHPQSDQILAALDQLGGELYLPGVGDEMKIAFTDIKGVEVDLEKMKDKVILVDFWATWCGPCVAEMPNVIAAYETYHEKGFEVVGISLDQDKSALEAFITDKKMPWPQYFDGKGWENELAQHFGISGIPATFLVGKGGKIVASNLHGPELEAAIEKALAE